MTKLPQAGIIDISIANEFGYVQAMHRYETRLEQMHNKHNIEAGQLVKYIGASRLLRSEQFEFVKETGNKVCCKRISDGVHWTFNMRDIEPI